MINTLNIGQYIYSTLKQIDGVGVYPLVAENGTKYPFLVYRRNNLISSSNKDGYFEDTVDVEITIVTDKYSKGVEIATEVRKLLEVPEVSFDDMLISETAVTMAAEEYSDNAFIQRMQFNMKVNN